MSGSPTLVYLPSSADLPVRRLAAVFDQVTNSYKFYWSLAILERAQNDRGRVMTVDEILTEMVALAWYPTNMFRLSLGKQDQLNDIPLRLREALGLAPHERPAAVRPGSAGGAARRAVGRRWADSQPRRVCAAAVLSTIL